MRVVTHFENTSSEEGPDNVGYSVRDPEEGKANGKLCCSVKVAEVQDCVGDETTLDQTQKRTSGEEGTAALDADLSDSDSRPTHHLDGDPDIRAEFLGDCC
jgi:hypothetical protein